MDRPRIAARCWIIPASTRWRSVPVILPIAVNVPPEEADVHTIDDSALKNALGGIDVTLNNDQPVVLLAQSSVGDDWGWTVMLCVLGLVGAESFLAMRFGHHRRT